MPMSINSNVNPSCTIDARWPTPQSKELNAMAAFIATLDYQCLWYLLQRG